MITYLLSSKEIVLTDDILKQKTFLTSAFLNLHNIQSGLGIVIKGTDLPFGIMIVYSSGKRNYTGNDSAFLKAIANVLTASLERKNAEEMTMGLLEAVPDAVMLINKDGKILMVNTQTEKIFGYKKDEILYKDVEIFIPARFRNMHYGERNLYLKKPWHRPMSSGLDLYGRRRDGTEFPAEISLSPFSTRQGTLITVSVRDISERKKSELAIREQAQLIDQIYGAVVSTDLKGTIRSWNKGAESIFGYTADEMLGKNISVLHGNDKLEYVQNNIIKPLTEKGFHQTGINLFKKNGEEFYAHLSLSLLKNKFGKIAGMIGYSMDITGLKNAEEKFDNFVKSSPQAIVISDLNGKVLNLNPEAEKLFEYEKNELVGRKINAVLSPEIIDKISQIISGSIKSFETFSFNNDKEYFGIDRNHKEFFIQIGLSSIETENGRIIVCAIKKNPN